MRRLRDSRIDLINRILRRRAAANGRKLIGRMLAEQVKLQAYLSQRLTEIEAAALAGDQRVRDDMGGAIAALAEAHNESCEALVEQANTSEQAIKVIAERVMRGGAALHGGIPDSLNHRPRFDI